MDVRDRLLRMDNEDIILLGELCDTAMKGEFGRLLRAMIDNLKSLELQNSRAQIGTSDKVLGRLEAYETIMNDLEAMVAERNKALRPVERDVSESFSTEEQVSPLRGGQI